MATLRTIAWSSVAKKLINGVTGLCLCGFIVIHLAGNLTLLTGNAEKFNAYAHLLLSTGVLLYLAEAGLLAFFLFHALTAVTVWWGEQVARPVGYKKTARAGDPSKKSLSSRTMIYTGAIMFLFTAWHLITFKYGPGVEEGYVMNIDGVVVRDLYRLTVEVFAQPVYVFSYVVIMALLGFHLRHGFWSAFQSLGAMHPRYTPVVYGIAFIFAVVMAVGFLAIPVVIYLKGGAA